MGSKRKKTTHDDLTVSRKKAALSTAVSEAQITVEEVLQAFAHDTMPLEMEDQVYRLALYLGNNICDNFEKLKTAVKDHGVSICKIWENKPAYWREKHLNMAWPDMLSDCRMIGDPNETDKFKYLGMTPVERINFIWPYMNVHILKEERPFLDMMYARSQNPPINFILSESYYSAAARRILGCGEICKCGFQKKMILTDDSTEGRYVQIQEPTQSYKNSNLEAEICPKLGLLSLYIQNGIMDFLRVLSQLLSEKNVPQNAKKKETSLDPDTTPSEARDTITLEPFQPRLAIIDFQTSIIDFEKISYDFKSYCMNHKDDLVLLRQDPSYFTETLTEVREHSIRQLRTKDGNMCSEIELRNESGEEIIIQTYISISRWTRAQYLVDRVSLLCNDSSTNRHSLYRHFVWFQKQCRVVLYSCLEYLRESLCAMRKFRHSCRRYGSQIFIDKNSDRDLSKLERILLGYIEKIVKLDRHMTPVWDLLQILGDINILFDEHKAMQKMMTYRVSQLMTETSMIAKCLHQFEINSREPQDFSYVTCQCSDCTVTVALKFRELGKFVMEDNDDWVHFGLRNWKPPVEAVTPSSQEFWKYSRYKIQKRTMESVSALRIAEQKLDKFWQLVDQNFAKYRYDGDTRHECINDCLAAKVKRTPPWRGDYLEEMDRRANEERRKDRISEGSSKREKGATAQPTNLTQYIHSLPHDSGHQATGGFMIGNVKEKTKEKTRGVPGAIPEPVEAPAVDDQQEAPEVVTVKRKTYDVFETLFGVGGSRPVKWTDFTKAMADAGFTVEPRYGSSWYFKPHESRRVQQNISFHAPHPEVNIEYGMALEFGDKFERAYGWNIDTFEIA